MTSGFDSRGGWITAERQLSPPSRRGAQYAVVDARTEVGEGAG